MAKLSAARFAVWLTERAAKKDGYIMCAVGQDPRKLSEWYFSGQYSGAQLEKANYWRQHAERVWDCQGLADGYVTDSGEYGKVNVRARNNYASWCEPKGTGAIPAQYRTPGAAVFIHSASAGYITHVGYLVEPVEAGKPAGDWWVVEARGVMYGVVRTKLSTRPWNRWGLMTKYFDYETGADSAGGFALGDRLLKNGCEGADVKELQEALISLGYDCGRWGADGDYGDATEMAVRAFQADRRLTVDGDYGPITHKALTAALDEAAGALRGGDKVQIDGGQCYVRTQPNTGGAIMGVAKEGTSWPYAGETAENGWLKIAWTTGEGWVSGKYGRRI